MKNTQAYQAFLKSPRKSQKHTTYFEIYDKLFTRYQGKEITFVEIGVLAGGSLFMWREFFGPKARIIGIDLNPDTKKWEEHGFEIFNGSQSNTNFWESVIKQIGKIDVVLDDGGHTYLQQITTLEMLLPHINDNGMLVTEDTHTSYMTGFGPRRYSFINYVKIMIDNINLRFGGFKSNKTETRVWSVQCFESIVALHINRQATRLLSDSISNNMMDEDMKDFRYDDNVQFMRFDQVQRKLLLLKNVLGYRFLVKKIQRFLTDSGSQKSALKKYFKTATLRCGFNFMISFASALAVVA